MANEVVHHELATENIGAVNEDDKGKEMGISENKNKEDQVRRKCSEEDIAEQVANYVTTYAKNELNIRSSDLTTEAKDPQDDTTLKTQDKGELDEKMLAAVDDPPDSFFDGLLEDDFLDSLAVVDAWNPDADESSESNADEQQEDNTRRGKSDRNRQPPSESKRKNESNSKHSVSKGGRESNDRRRSRDDSSRKDGRRHAGTSVEVKRDNRERSIGRTVERSRKVGIGEHLKEVQRRHQHVRDRDRERNTDRRERDSRNRRDRKSREKEAEKNLQAGGGGGSGSSSRENNDKSVERSIQKCDKGRGHRYSYQYRVSNRGMTSDKSGKERKSDLQSLCMDGKDGVLQNVKDSSRREDVTDESLRKEKSSDIKMANKESQLGSVHKEHDMEKEMSHGLSDVTEGETGDQSHMVTRPNNSALSDTKLDTCIKELDDLVPPGTESDFILPTKDEAVEFKKENIRRVKEEHEIGIVNDKDLLSRDWKSLSHPVRRTEISEKEIHVASEKSSDRKVLEGIKSKKDPSCTTSRRPHKGADRLDSLRERKRRRSGSSSSEKGRSLASGSKKKRDHLDEERKRNPQNNSFEEKKRNSTSLEKKHGAARVKSELDETGRKRKLYGSDSGKNSTRSRSREKWQHHSDTHKLKRKKGDQIDTRRSRSGSRGKKRELSIGRERMGRSRSRDRQHRKTQNDTRRSRSGSRGKVRELLLEQESMGRSRDQGSQYRKASSAERWQSDINEQRLKRKNDVHNESRRLVRSVSRDKERDSSLPKRKLRSHSRDREYRNVSSKYRDMQERPRRSMSQEVEKKRSSLKSRQSPSWDRSKRRTPDLSPFSAGRMSLSSSISFELSPSPAERERRRLSRSLSRERRRRECRRSYRGSSFSPLSSRLTLSRSGSCVSLSLSDESYYRRQPKRKRSPFWKEIERKFAKDFPSSVYSQPVVYPLPSEVGPTHHGGYDPSSSTAPGTFSPSSVPYPPYPSTYTHGYPPHTGFSDAVVQPPPPQSHIPPSFGSAPPAPLPVPPVMPPTPVPQPVPPPVYNVPPPALPLEHTDTVAPFVVKTELSSVENVFSQLLRDSEKSEDSPQVPPPPRISQSCDVKKMSLSSLLEASAKGTLSSKDALASKDHAEEFKVGGATKKKQMSFDPLLVVRCEEAIRALEANDGMMLVCPGRLVLQESPKAYSSATTVTQVLLDASAFQSPILHKPDLQLSFTSAPVCDDELAESSYDFLKLDSKSVQGQLCSEPVGHCAVTSTLARDSVENFKVYVDSSAMTDICGDNMTLLKKSLGKSQDCLSCLERSKRIMVWNYTQTPPDMRVSDKVMVWNSTQTPHVSVDSVGVQAQMVNIGTLRKLDTGKRTRYPRRNVKERGSVKSVTAGQKVNKGSSSSHANVSKSTSSDGTSTLKEDMNKEGSESRQQSPRRSHLSTSADTEFGRRDKDTSHRTSSYQVYGRSSFSASSSGRSDKEGTRCVALPQTTEPPRGILKTRTNVDLQPPPMPSPHIPGQEPSLKGCDLPRYSVTSTLQTSKSYRREVGNSPGLYSVRQGSSSFGEMEPSSTMQRSVSSSGSMNFGSTSASFTAFGNPDIRVTLSRSQDFNAFHLDRFSPSPRRSGSPGPGLRMQPFEEQSSKAFHHLDDCSMMPHIADRRY